MIYEVEVLIERWSVTGASSSSVFDKTGPKTDCIRLHVHVTFYEVPSYKTYKKVFVANIINCAVHGSQGIADSSRERIAARKIALGNIWCHSPMIRVMQVSRKGMQWT